MIESVTRVICPEERGIIGNLWRAIRLGHTSIDQAGLREVVWVLTWFIQQLPLILRRFPATANDERTRQGMLAEAYWPTKLTKFTHRAAVLTLDSPEGRQAVFELMSTTIGWCASIWRVYGPPASWEGGDSSVPVPAAHVAIKAD